MKRGTVVYASVGTFGFHILALELAPELALALALYWLLEFGS